MECSAQNPVLDAYNGACVLIPKGLHKSGLATDLDILVFQAFAEVAGRKKAEEVKAAGVEQIHQILPLSALIRSNHRLNQLLTPHCLKIAKGIVTKGLEYRTSVYISKQIIARFMVPFSFLDDHERSEIHSRNPRKCCGGIEKGKVKPHELHRDSWYNLPANILNLWVAMSEVVPGNGIVIFPEMFGKEVPHAAAVMERNVSTGPSINFSLEKGDVLLFNGDHLHASEANRTNRTRFVISLRFYVSRPKYRHSRKAGVRFYHSTFISTSLEKVFCVPAYFPWDSFKGFNLRKLKKRTKKLIPF
jgi:hypothetical protein